MEIWKEVKGYEGFYCVSNYGRVKDSSKLIPFIHIKTGYVLVYLSLAKKNMLVHRLVASAFMDDFDNKKMVNHIDFNKANNHLSNLEMVSNRENQCHYIKSKNKYIGISFHKKLNKWTAQIMINGKLKYIGKFLTDLEAYNARIEFEIQNGIVNKYI